MDSCKSVRAIRRFCAMALLMMATGLCQANPTQQPLLYGPDISYIGKFNLPNPGGSFDYGGMGVAISADGSQLYVGGNTQSNLGIVEIPDPIGGTATLVQGQTNVSGGIGGTCAGAAQIGGALVYNGRLIVNKLCYYDNEGRGNTTAAGNLNISKFSSFTRLDNLPYRQYASGYMGHIPPEWQSLLGGPAFAGNSSVSINSLTSNGPSFYVFDPDDVGVVSPIPSIPLMYFPWDTRVLGGGDGYKASDIYAIGDRASNLVFPSGTRSVLYWHRHGYGPYKYKVNDGCGGSGGESNAPYRRQITAFDANDLLAVKNGTKNPWEIEPYAWWVWPGPPIDDGGDSCAYTTPYGLAYDPLSRRVFAHYGNNTKNEIHVWQVSGDPGLAPPDPPQGVQ